MFPNQSVTEFLNKNNQSEQPIQTVILKQPIKKASTKTLYCCFFTHSFVFFLIVCETEYNLNMENMHGLIILCKKYIFTFCKSDQIIKVEKVSADITSSLIATFIL